jgi:hypothetical protein
MGMLEQKLNVNRMEDAMKRSMTIMATMVFIICAVNCYAQSSAGSVDETFAKATRWLQQEKLSITKTATQAFVNNCIVVEGEGLPSKDASSPGQKRLTALRAAEVVAYRRLAELLDGVTIAGDTMTRDLALRYDVVRVAVSGFVKGAQVVYREYNEKEETALVLVKIGMKGPSSYGEMVYSKIIKEASTSGELLLQKEKKQFTAPKPAILEASYDGLIIDATEYGFRPALINRVFTLKGEVLYDPAKVQEKILVEHGCGDYTNSVEKARSALQTRGAQNPMVIKAAGTVNPADLKVADDDAVKIFSANQKANFLSNAKVAFVLK